MSTTRTTTTTTRRALARLLPALALALLPLAGCGEREEEGRLSRQVVKVEEVPDTVMAAAQKRLPGIEFNEAWKNFDADKTLHSYEIRGRNDEGKIREARVSPSGEILEVE